MLPSSSMRPPPLREPNSSRNITGKASEKKAENGLRRNSLFWARTWRQSSPRSDGRPAAVTAGSGMGRLRGVGQPEVDVLQRRPGHGQGVQLLASGQRPGGEDAEGPGGLGGAQLDPVLARLRPAGPGGRSSRDTPAGRRKAIRASPSSRPPSESGVPAATTRPAARMATRSARL